TPAVSALPFGESPLAELRRVLSEEQEVVPSNGLPDRPGPTQKRRHLLGRHLHEVHRVAGDPRRPVAPAAEGGDPPRVALRHAWWSDGEDVQVTGRTSRPGGERTED